MDMILFVIVHERVGFCLGAACGLIVAGLAIWITQILSQ